MFHLNDKFFAILVNYEMIITDKKKVIQFRKQPRISEDPRKLTVWKSYRI